MIYRVKIKDEYMPTTRAFYEISFRIGHRNFHIEEKAEEFGIILMDINEFNTDNEINRLLSFKEVESVIQQIDFFEYKEDAIKVL